MSALPGAIAVACCAYLGLQALERRKYWWAAAQFGVVVLLFFAVLSR